MTADHVSSLANPKDAPNLRGADFTVRLARTEDEIKAAQALRYDVFYKEGKANASLAMKESCRDFDEYDAVADHLIAIKHDQESQKQDQVIGTYRLVRQPAADKVGQFYTSSEFDLTPLLNSNHTLLELGRSCVAKPFRTRPVLQKLWAGITAYLNTHDITMMFGCASLPGIDITRHMDVLKFLHQNHIAPDHLRPEALNTPHACKVWDEISSQKLSTPLDKNDTRHIFKALPPLIKGYLKLGAYIGDGAVIDPQFNTTDVCIVLPVENVSSRHKDFYDRKASKDSRA